jgi:hypothetical protein
MLTYLTIKALYNMYEGPGQKSCTFSGQKLITPYTIALNLML